MRRTLGRFLFGFSVLALLLGPSAALAGAKSYSGGRFIFVMDGTSVGFEVHGFEALTTQSVDLESTRLGAELQPAAVEAFSLQVGMGGKDALQTWIQKSLRSGTTTRNGVIHACNQEYESMVMREFVGARITEVTFPTLDAGSKDPAYMTVKLQAERVTQRKGDGRKLQTSGMKAQKKWLASNFTFEMGGLPTRYVSKIDAITIKQTVRGLEVSNLKVSVSMRDWEAWAAAAQHQSDQELTGAVEFLSADLKATLARIDLSGLKFRSLGIGDLEANSVGAVTFTAELEVGRLAFSR